MLQFGFVVLMIVTINARAATTIYTNESAFTANVTPGFYLEDFDAYLFGSFSNRTLSLSGGSGFAYTISTTPGVSGLYSGDGNMSTDSHSDALLVTFTGAAVYAVGGFFFAADLDGNYQTGNIVITLSDGTIQTSSPPDTITFLGFISDQAITSIKIDAPDNIMDSWSTMDHFYVGSIGGPFPFQVTRIAKQGNDVLIEWQTTGGFTNVVQATSGDTNGSYSNNFTDLSPTNYVSGSGAVTTNYLDVGGATNSPSRFYRVRMIP